MIATAMSRVGKKGDVFLISPHDKSSHFIKGHFCVLFHSIRSICRAQVNLSDNRHGEGYEANDKYLIT